MDGWKDGWLLKMFSEFGLECYGNQSKSSVESCLGGLMDGWVGEWVKGG